MSPSNSGPQPPLSRRNSARREPATVFHGANGVSAVQRSSGKVKAPARSARTRPATIDAPRSNAAHEPRLVRMATPYRTEFRSVYGNSRQGEPTFSGSPPAPALTAPTPA